MQEHRVPAGPVLTVVETLLDDQLDERGFWSRLPHLGLQARVPERAFHLDGEAPFRRAPRPGEHSLQILREMGLPERQTETGPEAETVMADQLVGPPGGHDVP
jgi:crotonobetainyl-CoA:carnitine CoA-transferase CaiB-like acyl-CoA transferase